MCRAKNVPYCFIKSKSRLGQLVNKKFTSCIAITDIKKEDQNELSKLAENFLANYNNNKEHFTKSSEVILGQKAQKRNEKLEKAKEAELMQKQ